MQGFRVRNQARERLLSEVMKDGADLGKLLAKDRLTYFESCRVQKLRRNRRDNIATLRSTFCLLPGGKR